MIDLDEIIESMNLPKRVETLEELELLADETDDKVLEKMVEKSKEIKRG